MSDDTTPNVTPNVTPAYLAQLFEFDDAVSPYIGGAEPDEQAYVRLPLVNAFSTPGSSHDPTMAKKLCITNGVSPEGEEQGFERINDYVDELGFILVDSLLTSQWSGNFQNLFGGQKFWPTDEMRNGGDVENRPLCSSRNGKAPERRFLGTPIRDPRTGATEKIGYRRDPDNGQYIPVTDGNVCIGCPFSTWMNVNGRNVQLCKQLFTFVIWTPKYGLLTITAGNGSVQQALVPRRNMDMKRFDQAALLGIAHYFKANPDQHWQPMEYAPNQVAKSMLGNITHVLPKVTEEIPNPMWIKWYAGEGATVEAVMENLMDYYEAVRVRVPSFPFMPSGRPDVTNPNRPVCKVFMGKVKTNASPSAGRVVPYVPDFYMKAVEGEGRNRVYEQWTPEEYSDYMDAVRYYHDKGLRDQLMGVSTIEAAKRELTPLLVERPAYGQIGAGGAPWVASEETAFEGSFTEADDL